MGWLNQVRAQARAGVSAPAEIRDVRTALDEMRVFKDDGELAVMRRAAAISVTAHERAMRATRPGRSEYEIEAELLYEFRRRGASIPPTGPSLPEEPTPASCITATTTRGSPTGIFCSSTRVASWTGMPRM